MLVLAFALANVVVAPLLIPTAAISDTDGCSHIDGACLLTLPPVPVLYFSFFSARPKYLASQTSNQARKFEKHTIPNTQIPVLIFQVKLLCSKIPSPTVILRFKHHFSFPESVFYLPGLQMCCATSFQAFSSSALNIF